MPLSSRRFPPADLARPVAVWVPATLIAVVGLLAAAAAQFAPGRSPSLVAVFPPWWTAERALAAASAVAPVAGARGAGLVIGVVADSAGVAQALRQGGALFVADGEAFPACFSSPRSVP